MTYFHRCTQNLLVQYLWERRQPLRVKLPHLYKRGSVEIIARFRIQVGNNLEVTLAIVLPKVQTKRENTEELDCRKLLERG